MTRCKNAVHSVCTQLLGGLPASKDVQMSVFVSVRFPVEDATQSATLAITDGLTLPD